MRKKDIKKPISIKYIQANSSPEEINRAFDILFEETLKQLKVNGKNIENNI